MDAETRRKWLKSLMLAEAELAIRYRATPNSGQVIPAETDIQRLLAYPAAYRRFCGL